MWGHNRGGGRNGVGRELMSGHQSHGLIRKRSRGREGHRHHSLRKDYTV